MMRDIPLSLQRDIKRHGYEFVGDGRIYVPKARMFIGGVFGYEVLRRGEIIHLGESHNLWVNQGLNHVLDVVLHGVTPVSPWYVGIFEGNYTPLATDTAANISTNATECTAYDEPTRQEYVEAAASGQSITNSASKATFTMNATKTVYGAFLASASTKGATTGVLLAADKAAAGKSLTSGDQLLVTYVLTAAAA